MLPLLSVVEECLRRLGVSLHDGCVLAVSGGRDSMLLLEFMARLQPRLTARLVVAHFHHQLRGADADADQKLVQTAAAARHLPIEIGTAPVKDRRRKGESIESAARRLRHAFLARVARKHRCRFIATAHHGDDQVELFLLRLLRGAGGLGLGGMELVDPSPADPGIHLVRPFLNLDSVALSSAAVELGVNWREDSSNRDPAFARNRIRHELIPLLQRHYQPSLTRVLRRTATLLEDQATAIEDLARRWLAEP
ncbi:MAG: tRNA lysidine(34) synthetase TilS, partial [Verrucomicrobiales bacterium]|nr:tRNA lysidine(34) synthetase TilS [Verrucomicrobiales bacterium]